MGCKYVNCDDDAVSMFNFYKHAHDYYAICISLNCFSFLCIHAFVKLCEIRGDNVNCEKCMCNDLKVMCNLLVTALIIA